MKGKEKKAENYTVFAFLSLFSSWFFFCLLYFSVCFSYPHKLVNKDLYNKQTTESSTGSSRRPITNQFVLPIAAGWCLSVACSSQDAAWGV